VNWIAEQVALFFHAAKEDGMPFFSPSLTWIRTDIPRVEASAIVIMNVRPHILRMIRLILLLLIS
jgi:hypothetical protein